MATAINLMQHWLDKAVALRADMLQSEVKFFLFLIEGERGSCPWKGQYTDFEQLLETSRLCSTQRYTAFRDALDRANGDVQKQIDGLGVDGVIEAGRITEAPKRSEFVARVIEGAKNQGCPLSARRVKQIGAEIQPRDRPSRRPTDEYDELRKEAKGLRAENKALRSENAALKKENESLKAKLKGKK